MLAYVGPGAGFMVAASLALLGAIGAAVLSLALWPMRTLWRLLRGRPRRDASSNLPPLSGFMRGALQLAVRGLRPIVLVMAAASVCHGDDWRRSTSATRVIVLGFDGMDYGLTREMMAKGLMPNFSRLAASGAFAPLASSIPPQSPVAWSSFITGLDPGGHGIFDFVHRDPRTMTPYLSTTRTEAAEPAVAIGGWRVPLSRGRVTLLRDGQPFWDVLEQHGVRTTIMRMPANYPPSGTASRELSGMGTPDILGTYGTFTFFTSATGPLTERTVSGGRVVRAGVVDGLVRVELVGPDNPFRRPARPVRIPFTVRLDPNASAARIAIGGEERMLRVGEWSDWVPIEFRWLPLQKLRGMCRFYLKRIDPAFELYVSPINLDPVSPAMPISTPAGWAADLAHADGRFHTVGIGEDTKGLSAGILTRDEFLQQADFVADESVRQYRAVLGGFAGGLLFYHFGGLDQVSHMLWRARDPGHPAYDANRDAPYASVVEDLYVAFDRLVGETLERTGPDTTLIVMSDHGFASWRRSFHLNAWLRDNGYLAVRDPADAGAGLLQNIDWSRTRAYGLGLNGVYINVAGRERWGVVPAAARAALVEEIRGRLLRAVDPATRRAAVTRAHARDSVYADSRHFDLAPDLIVGYARGTRVANESALGQVSGDVFADNTGEWSGDHCMDHETVPGILLSNRALRRPAASLDRVAAAILAEFGVAGFGATR